MQEAFAVSPLDGRYANQTKELSKCVSDFALTSYRVEVEVEWFLTLASRPGITELPAISEGTEQQLREMVQLFSIDDYNKIKEYEQQTNHDVKAVEYFLRDVISSIPEIAPHTEFVHFACTSEDINNLSYGLMLTDCVDLLVQHVVSVMACIQYKSELLKGVPMLSHTHGQPASPTTMGKEMSNMYHRLEYALDTLKAIKIKGKLNGAVGNFNAHVAAYPDVDWLHISEQFVTEHIGLSYNKNTTQIEPHDYVAELFHAIVRINNILIDASQDFWTYISM